MKLRNAQSGITLVMSLIMLIVLTLLVVSAIRFGNINLKIAGNAQIEAEASAATQVAIEKIILEISTTANIDTIPARDVVVSTGGASYTVNVAKPTCNLSRNIMNDELVPENTNDQACYGEADRDGPWTAENKRPLAPTECKDQQWDVAASYTDTSSGAKVSMLQGLAVRVGAQVTCPS